MTADLSFDRPPSSIPETRQPPSPIKQNITDRVGKHREADKSWIGPETGRDLSNVLRNRLNQMEYYDDFSLDSMPLVQKLLSDLIQTTDAARKFKAQIDVLSQEKSLANDQVAPLKNEVVRLTAENNRLHQDLIQIADAKEEIERKSQMAAKKLEAQTADLRFMTGQYSKRVEAEQAKVDQARDRVEQFMTKLGVFPIKAADKKSEPDKMFQRLQKIDIETGLEPLQQNPIYFTAPDPVIADMIQLSEARIENLESSISNLEAKIKDMESEAVSLRELAAKKDRELIRLGTQLEVSRSQQFGALQPTNANPVITGSGEIVSSRNVDIKELPAAHQRIEQLELQIEYLQDHVDALEKELASFEADKKEEIEAYRIERDEMAEGLSIEKQRCDGLLKSLDSLQKMVKELEEMKGRSKGDALSKEAAKASKLNNDLNLKLKDMEDQLCSSLKNSEILKRKNESLNAEVKSLKSAKNVDMISSNENEIRSLNSQMQNLEAEKWALNNELKISQEKIQALSQQILELQTYQARYQILQVEMDLKQKEFIHLSSRLKETETNQLKSLDSHKLLLIELQQAINDRDQLIGALEKLQARLNELHKVTEAVTAERDNLSGMYAQVNQELQKARTQPIHVSAVDSVAIPSEKEQISITPDENNGSELKKKIQDLEQQNSNLEEDLKMTIIRQREAGSSANEVLSQLESEIEKLRESVAEKEAFILELQENVRIVLQQKEQLNDESKAQLEVIEAQRLKITQLEVDRDRDRFHLRDVKSKVSDSEMLYEKYKSDIDRLEKLSEEKQKQIDDQRELLKQVDNERDTVQSELDIKAEAIIELQESIKMIKNECITLEQDNDNMNRQIDTLNHHLNDQDNEILALQRQLENMLKDRDFLAVEASRNAEESKNLASDLAAITKQNQFLNSELANTVGERDRYISELNECERQVQYLDELCRVKEQEKDQLMSSYRKLIGEHEKLELIFQSNAEDANNIKMEVIMRDKMVQQLQKSLNESSSDISQMKIDLAAYEKQCSNLTRSLATAERALKHHEMDKARMIREISAVRDLAQGLERRKDEIQKNLTVTVLENEQLENELKKMEAEREGITNQMRAEKLKADRLEHIVAMERTRKIHSERNVEDMKAIQITQDENLKAVNEQQSISLAALTKELVQANETLESMASQIRNYELKLSLKKEDGVEIEKKLHYTQQELKKIQEIVQTKELIIQDLMKIQRDQQGNIIGQSELDQRLLDELESTKRQLKNYEEQIAERNRYSELSRGNSDPSSSTNLSERSSNAERHILRNPIGYPPRTFQEAAGLESLNPMNLEDTSDILEAIDAQRNVNK